MLEIESKFRVGDVHQFKTLMAARGLQAEREAPIHQVDHYFQGLGRDFRQTGEALRLRVEDGRPFFTYKGKPTLANLGTKIRREIELDLAGNDPEESRDFLMELGFQPVGTVSKKRWQYRMAIALGKVTIALDEVENLGAFVEVEILVQDLDRDFAAEKILEVARSLGLAQPEPRSYLRMILEGQNQ